jgi:hypothetical protein
MARAEGKPGGPTRPDRLAYSSKKASSGDVVQRRAIYNGGCEVMDETRKQTAVPEGLPPTFGVPSPRPPLLRRKAASEHLKQEHGVPVAPDTLAGMARYGDGPAFHRFRGIPLYPRDELDRWAKEQLGPLRAKHPQR